MILEQVHSTPDGSVLFDGNALDAAPPAAWFDAALDASAEASPSGGRGRVVQVRTPVGICIVRHYRRGGWIARWSRDAYLWTGADATRPFREFRLLARLVDLGLPVCRPVAARYRRSGLHYRADLLTRRIDDARTLAETLATSRSTDALTVLGTNVGATLARFHAAGVWHADLNAHNVLVDGAETIWLIDFDRGELRTPDARWQAANLARLARSLHKLGLDALPGFTAFDAALHTEYRRAMNGATSPLAAEASA